MKAIILAAGEGRRLQPLTANMPKVMIPVGNRPILHYVVDALADNNIRDITIVVGYHSEKVRQYFGSGRNFGVKIDYVIQKKQLGTAHALYQARTDEEFILTHGDNILSKNCIQDIKKSDKNTILGIFSKQASKYGIIEYKGENVERIVEKPRDADENLIFTGVGHFGSDIFDTIETALEDNTYDLPGILNSVKGLKLIYGSNCTWRDAIYPWDLLELNSGVMKNTVRKLSGKLENATVVGDVEIGAGTRISAGCYIRGPVKIGKNCYIGANSVILPDTSIGNDVNIGALSLVKNSIIMSSTTISHQASIENSVIGRGCSINSAFAAISSSFRKIMDREVLERYEGGAIIGDDCRIGGKVSIDAGVRIGAGSKIGSMNHIKEDLLGRGV